MKKLIYILLFTAVISANLRFMEDLDTKLKADELEKGEAKKANKIESLTNAINQLCDSWGKIVTAFKTTHSKTIKEILPGRGFSKLNLQSELYVNIGLMDSKYEAYYKRRAVTLHLKDDYLKKFLDTFEFALWSDEGVWNKCDMVYDDDSESNRYNSVTVLVTESVKPDKHDIMITYFSAQFTLAPDLLWIHESKSVLGGIFEKTTERLEKKPRNLTDEEIEAIISMYKMFSLKFVADVLGIQIKLPDLS